MNINIYMYMYMYVCRYVCMYVGMYVCMHVCMYVYIILIKSKYPQLNPCLGMIHDDSLRHHMYIVEHRVSLLPGRSPASG